MKNSKQDMSMNAEEKTKKFMQAFNLHHLNHNNKSQTVSAFVTQRIKRYFSLPNLSLSANR